MAAGHTTRPGIVVSDPGSTPSLRMAAIGLARVGLLHSYVSPFAWAGIPALPSGLPKPVRLRMLREMSKRSLPEAVPKEMVCRRCSALEVPAVLARRLGLDQRVCRWLYGARNATFDWRVTHMLSPSQAALVARPGASLRSFRRAKALGLPSYLLLPIVHHRFAERLLTEEADLQPAFADTLQFHRFRPGDIAQLDDEIEQADHVLTPSALVERSCREAGVAASKLRSLPLGVDVDLFRPRSASERRSGFRVIFVGQITQRKGISYLFDAFRLAALPRSELLLVGQVVGSDRAWRAFPGVRRVGPVPRSQLPALYSQADVFVMPSLVEGFCLTALEAMACGLPSILSENVPAGELTDGVDGFVVPIRNAEAIASRLVDLYEHPEKRHALARAARRRALEFTWERYWKRLVEVTGAVPGRAK